MRVLVDVYDAAGNRLGAGPIRTAKAISTTRALSGAGAIDLQFPGGDERALDLLENERRVKVWVWDTESSPKRLLVEGIIRKVNIIDSAAGLTLAVSGPDILNELDRVNTWLGWQRNNTAVDQIVDDLVAEASGWTADTDDITALDPLSVRFDGVSALKALQKVCAQKGVHFRLEDNNTVKVGAFGTANGVIISHAKRLNADIEAHDNLAMIEKITFLYDSEALANRIVVLGPGDAEAALTLKFSTRIAPYPIQTMYLNGITHYYLEDTASVAAYGAIERTFTASSVSSLSNTAADIENASNALYDLASAWLQRYAVRQEVYRCTIRKVRTSIKPGDKVWLDYRGYAYNEKGRPTRWVKLRGEYWVTSATERAMENGAAVDLEISNIDRVEKDLAQVVLGAIDDLRLQGTVVKPYLSMYMQPFPQESIDSTHDVTLPFEFGDYVARLNQVILRLWTRPFRTNVTGSASGGGATSSAGGAHRHRMFLHTNTYDWSVSTYSKTWDMRCAANNAGGTQSVLFPANAAPGASEFWTDSAADTHTHTIAAHTHDLEYGIFDDTDTPEDVEIYVDNVLVSGGPYAPSGGNLELELDITSMFSETGFQGSHEIRVECGSGQGLVFGHLEVRQTIQSIRVV